jgi:alkyl sulfatase BDS1-like metallo-beta-lactamase superfamily hydrolase
VATLEQCEQALHALAARLAESAASRKRLDFDRTLSCTIRDLDAIFTGHLKDGQLVDIARAATGDAQVRLILGSDDLVALVDGRLKMAAAWATGRVRVQASVRDLYRLRTLF